MKRYVPSPQSATQRDTMESFAAQADRLKVRGRCRGCAFRKGMAANRCGRVAAAVEAAAMWDAPFHCHHETLRGPVVRGPDAPSRPCAGYVGLFRRFTSDNVRTSL